MKITVMKNTKYIWKREHGDEAQAVLGLPTDVIRTKYESKRGGYK